MSRMKKVFLMLVVICLSSLTAFTSQRKPELVQKERIKQIDMLPAARVDVETPEGSPVLVQDAFVREISDSEYKTLTGQPAMHFRNSTFPEVVFLNTSTKTIKSFGIVVESTRDGYKKGYVRIRDNVSIPPNSTYKIEAGDWVREERITRQEGKGYVTRWQKMGFDSTKQWIPAAASDLKVILGMVTFEDGTKWMVSPPGSVEVSWQ